MSFIEAAIVIPVILLVILGMIDFLRYIATKNTLEVAARQALTMAAVVPDLERWENEPAPDTGRFERALKSVADRARELGNNALFKNAAELTDLPDDKIVILPTPVAGTSNRNPQFATTPIEVKLDGEMKLIALPWFGTMAVSGSALGYREIQTAASNPIPLDCVGRPFNPDIPSDCNCAAGTHYSYQSGTCLCDECPSGRVRRPGSCACDCVPPLVDKGNGECGCDFSIADDCNRRGLPYDLVYCRCVDECIDKPECPCPAGDICRCPQWADPTFECPTMANGIKMILSEETCQCICPWGASDTNGGCECNPNNKWDSNVNMCVCNDDIKCPAAGMIKVNRDCTCACPAGQQVDYSDPNNPKCACVASCGSNQVQDPVTCGCKCQECPGGQVLDPATCGCSCPGLTTWNGTECACYRNVNTDCPPQTVLTADCSCGCDKPECAVFEDGIFVGCSCDE